MNIQNFENDIENEKRWFYTNSNRKLKFYLFFDTVCVLVFVFSVVLDQQR